MDMKTLNKNLKNSEKITSTVFILISSITFITIMLNNVYRQDTSIQLSSYTLTTLLINAFFIYIPLILMGVSILAIFDILIKKYRCLKVYVHLANYYLLYPALLSLIASFWFTNLALLLLILLYFINISKTITEHLFMKKVSNT